MRWSPKLVLQLAWRSLLWVPAGVVLALSPLACSPGAGEFVEQAYLPRSAHQAYGHALAQSNLLQTALGRDWLRSAEAALFQPSAVTLPVTQTGRFEPAQASALGLSFSVPAGRRLTIELAVDSEPGAEIFLDLYRIDEGGALDQVASAAPSARGAPGQARKLALNVLEEARYLLRVQPELLRGGEYRLAIETSAALEFPVEGLSTRAIQSTFGAERDGGVRSHRGVDIFAPRGTPALAAIDGWVSRVETTRIGGNVVWLQDPLSPLRLYYAHLDSQQVQPGQFVTAGDVLGRVGNTGNAITTPTHLHFGVYVRRRGARDPYLFLK